MRLEIGMGVLTWFFFFFPGRVIQQNWNMQLEFPSRQWGSLRGSPALPPPSTGWGPTGGSFQECSPPCPAQHETRANIPKITALTMLNAWSIPSQGGFERQSMYLPCPLLVLQSVWWWWTQRRKAQKCVRAVRNVCGLKTITYLLTASPSSSFSVPCRVYFCHLCGKQRSVAMSL